MNTHHDTDSYASPSISILGSLAQLTQITERRPRTSSAWTNSTSS